MTTTIAFIGVFCLPDILSIILFNFNNGAYEVGMMIYTRFSRQKETMFEGLPNTYVIIHGELKPSAVWIQVYAVGHLVRRSFVLLGLRLLQILAMQECRVNIWVERMMNLSNTVHVKRGKWVRKKLTLSWVRRIGIFRDNSWNPRRKLLRFWWSEEERQVCQGWSCGGNTRQESRKAKAKERGGNTLKVGKRPKEQGVFSLV